MTVYVILYSSNSKKTNNSKTLESLRCIVMLDHYLSCRPGGNLSLFLPSDKEQTSCTVNLKGFSSLQHSSTQ